MNQPKLLLCGSILRCVVSMMIAPILLGLLMVGCGEKNHQANISKYGGALYMGVETPFHGFDVLGVASGGILLPAMAMVNNTIQEPLFRMDKSGKLIPVLALSALPSANGTEWNITLRQNVYFHDGTPFNADAVVHHWRRILDPENKYRGRKTFQPIQGVEKINEFEVRFFLTHAWAPFLKVISDDIYVFASIPSPKSVQDGTHNRHPVGTGPFRFKRWNSGDYFIVVKNERYWRENRPFLNKIVFRVIPDHQSRYASLMAGEVDAITLDRGHLIKKANNDPTLYTYHYEESGAEIVRINTRTPPLDDMRVRQALALANDQLLHIKMVYGDSIPFIHHPFGEWFKCVDDGYPEHDLERARKLIADYGKPVEVECVHTNTSRGRSTGELLQQLYKEIGVTLHPVGLSTGPHIRKVLAGDFQIATSRIYSANDFGPQLFRSLHSESPTNYSGYRSADMDALLEAQRIETDPTRRNQLLCKIVKKINTDVPFFYRGGRRQHIVAGKKIRDVTDKSGIRMNLTDAWIEVKFNPLAYKIEQDSVVAVDCPDPGDTRSVQAVILGSWQGKDDWGATIKATFKDDDTVTGGRTGGQGGTRKYLICGPEVHWEAVSGAKIVVKLTEDKNRLQGEWQYASYSGKFTLKPTRE